MPLYEFLCIILDECWGAVLQEICSQNSFLGDREIGDGDDIHPKRVPHEWDLNWAERFDEAVCYTDNVQFIFPKDLRAHFWL